MSTTLFLANVMQNVVRKPEYDPAVKAICMAVAATAGTNGDDGRIAWTSRTDELLLEWFPNHLPEIDEAFSLLDKIIGVVELEEVGRE